MRACKDDKLKAEQDKLMELWFRISNDDIDPFEFVYQHASKELRAHFDRRKKQDQEDQKNGCITN